MPPTTQAIKPEINRPLILGRFSGRAQWYIASAAPGKPPRNAGILPCDKKRVALSEKPWVVGQLSWAWKMVNAPLDGMTAHLLRTTRFGKANQRHQNVMQAKGQQQTFASAENHRSKVAGAVDDMAQSTNAQRKNRPYKRDNQPDKAHNDGRDDRHKTRAAEKGQRIR
ncbi:Uncharacterised protein [Salmonella bongori]|nr:Uncharacterised protein [Salmonella bongori]